MSHHKKHRDSIPPGNQPHPGGEVAENTNAKKTNSSQNDNSFSQQDPKRRLGDYATAGEHPFQQPGGKNDANR